MNAYNPTQAWQRIALAAAGSVTSLAVLSGAALLFADRDDRQWIAAAMGLSPPAPPCGEGPAPRPGCPMQPALVAHAQLQAPPAAASAAGVPFEGVFP